MNVSGIKQGLLVINFHKLKHVPASVMAMLDIQDEIMNEKGGWLTNYTRDRSTLIPLPKSV